MSSVRVVEPLPVAVVATAPADGGGVECSGVLRHGVVCCGGGSCAYFCVTFQSISILCSQ